MEGVGMRGSTGTEPVADNKDRHGLAVYVLAHGRPEMTVLAVRSVMEQEVEGGFRFIVSDNSSDDSVGMALQAAGLADGTAGKSTRLEYRKRDEGSAPTLWAHLNLAIKETLANGQRYLIAIHNDDLMLPGMLQTELDTLQKGNYAACGCAAYEIDGKGRKTGGVFFNEKTDMVVHSSRDSLRQSLTALFGKVQYATFPSWMYDLSRMGHILPRDDAGPQSDLTWRARIAQAGELFILSKPLYLHRYWDGQWSHSYSARGYYLVIKAFSHLAKGRKDKYTIRMARVANLMRYSTLIRGRLPCESWQRTIRRSLPMSKRIAAVGSALSAVGSALSDVFVPPLARAYRAVMPKDLRKVLWRMRHPFKARAMQKGQA